MELKAIRHGTLNVTATINASASGLDIAFAINVPIFASAEVVVAVRSSEPPSVKRTLVTPRTASFDTIDETNARNVCQPMPKNFVTGSMVVPIL